MRKREFEHGVLYQGDCLNVMPEALGGKSINMVLADLPYSMTNCKWDSHIPLDRLWDEYKRVIRDKAAIVLTGSQPFTSLLVASNFEWFKYEWIWQKNKGSNFAAVKFQPFKEHENVCIFSKGKTVYHPQKRKRSLSGKNRLKYSMKQERGVNPITGLLTKTSTQNPEFKMPGSVIKFNCEMGLHPAQKPVALFEYLIKTYTNEGDTVLDNVIGSGTTAVAAFNTDRRWIGIEKDPEIFETACMRIERETRQQILVAEIA